MADDLPPPPPWDRSWEMTIKTGDSLEETRAQFRWTEGERPGIKIYNDRVFNHDRQRIEHRYMLYDYKRNLYVQEWRDIDTGEVMFRKEGKVGDPSDHGVSARGGEVAKPGIPRQALEDADDVPRILNIGFEDDGSKIVIQYSAPLPGADEPKTEPH